MMGKQIDQAQDLELIKSGRTSEITGASFTISFVMPVRDIIFFGIGISGLTKVVNSSENSPFTNLQAEISVILSLLGSKPVVSKSKEIYSSNFKSSRRAERECSLDTCEDLENINNQGWLLIYGSLKY